MLGLKWESGNALNKTLIFLHTSSLLPRIKENQTQHAFYMKVGDDKKTFTLFSKWNQLIINILIYLFWVVNNTSIVHQWIEVHNNIDNIEMKFDDVDNVIFLLTCWLSYLDHLIILKTRLFMVINVILNKRGLIDYKNKLVN